MTNRITSRGLALLMFIAAFAVITATAQTYNPITGARIPPGQVTIKSVEFTRPANTTQYTAGDAVAPATKTITAASNATPIVVTATSHGYATDDRVTIASVGGNTNANGTFKIAVLTANTFALYNDSTGAAIAGNAAYTSGGTAQKLLRFADVVPDNAGPGSILGARLIAGDAGVTTATFRLRFYNSPISQIADNAAFTLLYANRTKQVADMALTTLITEGAGSDMALVTFMNAVPIPFVCADGRRDLFVQIEAIGAYTPASAETFRLEVTIRRDTVGLPVQFASQ
jgi:hypothetical protein